MNGRMIDRNPTFGHHFFEMPQAQWIGHVPAHASQNHVEPIMQAFEHSATGGFSVFVELSVVHVVPHMIADRLTATEPTNSTQT